MNPLLDRLAVDLPVILAPMGGGPGTPEMAAAVSNAGGLGSLAAAYLTPDEIAGAIRRVRSLTAKPFNVNLFAGGYGAAPVAGAEPEPMLSILAEIHRGLGLPAPGLPPLERDPFPDQLEAVLETRPAVFSFTFGIPGSDALRRLRSRGIAILGTATTVEEARLLADAGVDGIVAQGAEAGAHRGTFAGPFEAAMIPALELTQSIARFAPVIASGGIMDGRDIARMLENGASAVQLGTAFLACPESGASAAYKQALLAAKEDTTVITRAFSGRPARGLGNAFTALMEGRQDAILPFPRQNSLTRPMRSAAAKQGAPGFLSLWAGQGVARCRTLPAAGLVARLMEEADRARARQMP